MVLPVLSFRFGKIRFDSVKFGLVKFGSVKFGLVKFSSVRGVGQMRGLPNQIEIPIIYGTEMLRFGGVRYGSMVRSNKGNKGFTEIR